MHVVEAARAGKVCSCPGRSGKRHNMDGKENVDFEMIEKLAVELAQS